MSKSEIFESFIKIAQEKGMISEDAPEKAKKILEKDPRWDSLDLSAIEVLYGVKPNTPKDMEYKKNIIESAHPNAVVISPSYDKLNGLVENNNERQDIMLNIVNRNPDGHGNLHKNAEKDFILSLVRVGNDLDNQNKTKLRILADTCLQQVSIKKTAVWPVAIGIAVALGALYAQQHMSFTNEGFQKNHEKLMGELNDLINSNSDWGVGSQYTPEFHAMLVEFQGKLTKFYNLYQKTLSIINNFEKPKTARDLIEIAQKPDTSAAGKAYKMLSDYTSQMVPYLKTIKQDFSSEGYKARQTADKGVLTSLVDKMKVFHGGKGLVADDFDDVVRAIDPYQESIKELLNILLKADAMEKASKSQIEQASYQSQKEFGSDIGDKSESPGGGKPPSSPSEGFGIEDLEKDLLGGL